MAKVNDALRAEYLNVVIKALGVRGEEVIRTNTGEVAIPVVDAEGNEKYVVFTVKVPTGSRDGDAYDAYEMADEYKAKVDARKAREAKKIEAAAAREAKKAKAKKAQ